MARCTGIDETEREVVVRVDGHMVMRVSPRYFRRHPLTEGDVFDAAAYARKYALFLTGQATDRVGRMLARRAHSEHEIKSALERGGYPTPVVRHVLALLHVNSLLDDNAFADAWIAARNAKSVGIARIAWELRGKGLDRDAVDAALARACPADMRESAVRYARKRIRSQGTPETPQARRRLLQALARRGFAQDTARDALREALAYEQP